MNSGRGFRGRLVVVLCIAGVLAAGIFWDPLAGVVEEGWRLLLSADPEAVRVWLLEFGIWAPVLSGLLQVLSSLIPFLPGFVLSIVNAMLYGALLGGLLTFFTSLLAAATCFGIARMAGQPAVERMVSPSALEQVNRFITSRGWWAVFWGRLIPFINPDIVSYAAGLTRLRWLPFLTAMAAGALPAITFYSLVGASALEAAPRAIGLVTLATLLPLLALWFFRGRILRRAAEGPGGKGVLSQEDKEEVDGGTTRG